MARRSKVTRKTAQATRREIAAAIIAANRQQVVAFDDRESAIEYALCASAAS